MEGSAARASDFGTESGILTSSLSSASGRSSESRRAMKAKPVPQWLSAIALIAALLAPANAGAYGVGYREIRIDVNGEGMLTSLWYPTEAPSGHTAIGPFTMPAAPDAPFSAGPFGLILISHGTGGSRLNHRGTAIQFAKAGYVVAAPEHTGDNWQDDRHAGRPANWRRRPGQLSSVLDRLLEDTEFREHIDPKRIGAIGHSAGGYSALALVGGKPDLCALARHCTERRDRDPVFCSYGRPEGHAQATIPGMADRRVGAVVAVAPVGALFSEGAFTSVEAPVQIHRLDADRVLREPWHAHNIAKLLGRNAILIGHPGAHHFAFISPFPAGLENQVGEAARDPSGFDRHAFLAGIDRQILEFFDEVLPVP